MKIAFVVSGNGYGHLRRVCTVAEEIFRTDPQAEVMVIGAGTHGEMLNAWKYAEAFRPYKFLFIDGGLEKNLKASIDPGYTFDAYQTSFHRTLQVLHTFKPDRVVSDNLAGILAHYPHAVLMGSFLWSDTLHRKYEGNPEIEKICRYEAGLLTKHNPVMLGVEDMVMPHVKAHTRFMGLPWFCKHRPLSSHGREANIKSHVLLTGGGTRNASARLLTIAEQLQLSGFFSVMLDFSLYHQAEDSLRQRCTRFDFSEDAFKSLDRIICRPGIGILTDAIQYLIPVCVLEEEDKEMQFNCARVEEMGIGVRVIPDNNAIADQLLSLDAEVFRKNQAERKTGGAAAAAHYILNS